MLGLRALLSVLSRCFRSVYTALVLHGALTLRDPPVKETAPNGLSVLGDLEEKATSDGVPEASSATNRANPIGRGAIQLLLCFSAATNRLCVVW